MVRLRRGAGDPFPAAAGSEEAATADDLEDAEDTAAVLEWKARDAAGLTTFVSAGEAEAPAGHVPVSLRVDYDERAISQAAAFLDDPQGMRAVLDAIARLADHPCPAGSFPYGSPDLRRLRAGRYGPVRDHRRRDRRPAHRPRHQELTGGQAASPRRIPEGQPGGGVRLIR